MAIASQITQVGANTDFLSMANAIFDSRKDGLWTQLAEVVSMTGKTLELDALGPAPAVRKLQGDRRYGNLRAYVAAEPAVEWAADALEIPRIDVEGDKSGVLARRLSDYLAQTTDFLEKPVIDTLLGNPLGIDGVSLINDSHPHAPSAGTWDNKTTDTLSQTSLEAGFVAMRGYRYENGEPGGYRPTTLVVSPKWEREALDLIGDTRMNPIKNDGTPDGTSSVVAAVMIKNWVGGRLNLMVVDRFYDGTYDDNWYLVDLSRPGVRPLVVGELIAPMGVVVDQPGSEPMLQRSSYAYYVQAAAAIRGYAPQTIYGKVA